MALSSTRLDETEDLEDPLFLGSDSTLRFRITETSAAIRELTSEENLITLCADCHRRAHELR